MQQKTAKDLSQWLRQRCQEEHLSLRKAGIKAGLSHSTIQDILRGQAPSLESIHKLADTFGGNGEHQKQALMNELLTFVGHRYTPPESELSQPRAALLDAISEFTEPQIKLMIHFAEFVLQLEREKE